MAQDKKRDQYKESFKFDKRLNERLMTLGDVQQEEYETYLKNLPDLGAHVDLIHMAGNSSSQGGHSTH
jgi:hypothetical protein